MGSLTKKTEHSKDSSNPKKTPETVQKAAPEVTPETQAFTNLGMLQRSACSPTGLSPRAVPGLQRSLGNRYVQAMITGAMQGKPQSEIIGGIQAQAQADEASASSPPAGSGGVELDQSVSGAITGQVSRGGQPLPEESQKNLKSDLGVPHPEDIQVHTGPQADELSQSLGARAFTTGEHIFFREGEYDPGTAQGQKLLYHESVHTLQQGAGRGNGGSPSGSTSGALTVNPPGDAYEQEAEGLAEGALSGAPGSHGPQAANGDEDQRQERYQQVTQAAGQLVSPSRVTPARVQRDENEEATDEEELTDEEKEERAEASKEGDKAKEQGKGETKDKGKEDEKQAKDQLEGGKKGPPKAPAEKGEPKGKPNPPIPFYKPDAEAAEARRVDPNNLPTIETPVDLLPSWSELASGTVQLQASVGEEYDWRQATNTELAGGGGVAAAAVPAVPGGDLSAEAEGGGESTDTAPPNQLDMANDALKNGVLGGLTQGAVSFGTGMVMGAFMERVPGGAGFLSMAQIAYDPAAWFEDNVMSIGKAAVNIGSSFKGMASDANTVWGKMAAFFEGIVAIIDFVNGILQLVSTILNIIMAISYLMVLLAGIVPFCIMCWTPPIFSPIIAFITPISKFIDTITSILGVVKMLFQPIIIVFRYIDLIYAEADPEILAEKQAKLQQTVTGFTADATQFAAQKVQAQGVNQIERTRTNARGKQMVNDYEMTRRKETVAKKDPTNAAKQADKQAAIDAWNAKYAPNKVTDINDKAQVAAAKKNIPWGPEAKVVGKSEKALRQYDKEAWEAKSAGERTAKQQERDAYRKQQEYFAERRRLDPRKGKYWAPSELTAAGGAFAEHMTYMKAGVGKGLARFGVTLSPTAQRGYDKAQKAWERSPYKKAMLTPSSMKAGMKGPTKEWNSAAALREGKREVLEYEARELNQPGSTRIADQGTTVTDAETNKNKAQADLNATKANTQAKQDAAKDASTKSTQADKDHKQATKDEAEAEKGVTQARQEYTQAQQKEQAAKNKLDEANKELTDATKKVDEGPAKLRAAEAKKTAAEQEFQNAAAKRATAEGEYNAAKAERDTAQTQAKDALDAKNKAEGDLRDANQQLSNAQKADAAAQQRLKAAQDRVTALKAAPKKDQKAITTAEGKQTTAGTAKGDAAAEVGRKQAAVATATNKVGPATQANKDANIRVNGAENKLKAKEQTLEKAQTTEAEKKKARDDAEQELQQLKTEQGQDKTAKTEAEKKVQQATQDHNKAKDDVQHAHDALKDAKAEARDAREALRDKDRAAFKAKTTKESAQESLKAHNQQVKGEQGVVKTKTNTWNQAKDELNRLNTSKATYAGRKEANRVITDLNRANERKLKTLTPTSMFAATMQQTEFVLQVIEENSGFQFDAPTGDIANPVILREKAEELRERADALDEMGAGYGPLANQLREQAAALEQQAAELLGETTPPGGQGENPPAGSVQTAPDPAAGQERPVTGAVPPGAGQYVNLVGIAQALSAATLVEKKVDLEAPLIGAAQQEKNASASTEATPAATGPTESGPAPTAPPPTSASAPTAGQTSPGRTQAGATSSASGPAEATAPSSPQALLGSQALLGPQAGGPQAGGAPAPDSEPVESAETDLSPEVEETPEAGENYGEQRYLEAMAALMQILPPPPEGLRDRIDGLALAYSSLDVEQYTLTQQTVEIDASQGEAQGSLEKVTGMRAIGQANQVAMEKHQEDADQKLEAQGEMKSAAAQQDNTAKENAKEGSSGSDTLMKILGPILQAFGMGGGQDDTKEAADEAPDPGESKEGGQLTKESTAAGAEMIKETTSLSASQTGQTQQIKSETGAMQGKMSDTDAMLANKQTDTEDAIVGLAGLQVETGGKIESIQSEKEDLRNQQATAWAQEQAWAEEHQALRETFMADLEADLANSETTP